MKKFFTGVAFAALLMVSAGFTMPLAGQGTFDPDTVQAGTFDMGKMWTFDFAPKEYFSKTYNFNADDQWFDGVRMSALRFGGGCTASFVSGDGLVMTNHHCGRGSVVQVQKEGENFLDNGFYAEKLTDERKVDKLYVDQLVKIEDITARVQNAISKDSTPSGKMALRSKEFEAIRAEYAQKEEWKGLELQPVTFYNGGKYSLYGYKRYTDVRLVFAPELQLGFYGGDYDNFTYPRYDLDCSFFRVYGEDGKPLKTANYFKFNLTGVTENEPIFVVGNPGSTRRLFTMSDLEFRRDMTDPAQLALLRGVANILHEVNAKLKRDSLTNLVFGLENSWKSINGDLVGLQDPYLMARKAAFEKKFKKDASARPEMSNRMKVWEEIEEGNKILRANFNEIFILNPNGILSGAYYGYALGIANYQSLKARDQRRAAMMKGRLATFTPPQIPEAEEKVLALYLQTLQARLGKNDPVVVAALGDRNPADAAAYLLKNTKLNDAAFREQLLADSTVYAGTNDPMIAIARLAVPRYLEISAKYSVVQDKLATSRSQLGTMVFDLYGTKIPPDATFTLRINDGLVKGYEYNGTIAPYKTTFYGLLDRYYSFDGKYPFQLPERWKNLPPEMLKVGMDFVSTNDIIGGNSGSAMINKNREVIGLVFDGNIESLSGGFIYEDIKNRAVGVNSAAMIAAMKHVYKAKRLVNELSGVK
ncbi:MAG: S46 family peptidase [Bacteroidales bacterium]